MAFLIFNKPLHIIIRIERWHNRDRLSKREIAKRFDKSERTIRREIKRGITINLNTYLEEIEIYSVDIAHNEYLLNLETKGQEIRIGSNIELVTKIEKMIKEEKKSPEVIAYELTEKGLIDITARTIRNYIYDGNVFNLVEEDMIYNKKHKAKNKDKRIAKHTPSERSIENRTKGANERREYGRWEGDLIIGKRKNGCILLTFTERMTREEIIIKIKGKNNEYVVKAINGLERKYGKNSILNLKRLHLIMGLNLLIMKEWKSRA